MNYSYDHLYPIVGTHSNPYLDDGNPIVSPKSRFSLPTTPFVLSCIREYYIRLNAGELASDPSMRILYDEFSYLNDIYLDGTALHAIFNTDLKGDVEVLTRVASHLRILSCAYLNLHVLGFGDWVYGQSEELPLPVVHYLASLATPAQMPFPRMFDVVETPHVYGYDDSRAVKMGIDLTGKRHWFRSPVLALVLLGNTQLNDILYTWGHSRCFHVGGNGTSRKANVAPHFIVDLLLDGFGCTGDDVVGNVSGYRFMRRVVEDMRSFYPFLKDVDWLVGEVARSLPRNVYGDVVDQLLDTILHIAKKKEDAVDDATVFSIARQELFRWGSVDSLGRPNRLIAKLESYREGAADSLGLHPDLVQFFNNLSYRNLK